MTKSRELRLSDVRRLMALSADLATLPTFSEPWLEHLLTGMLRLVPAKTAFFQDQHDFRPGGCPVSNRGYAVGFLDDDEKRGLARFVEEINRHGARRPDLRMRGGDAGRVAYHGALPSNGFDPFLQRLMHVPRRLYTRRRRDLVPDDEWRRSPVVTNHFGPMRIGDNVITICRVNGRGRAIGFALYRDAGDPPITRRERAIVHLVHAEASRAYAPVRDVEAEANGERGLEGAAPGAEGLVPGPGGPEVWLGLSPRLRQTLDALLAGDGEKQIAYRLGLSRNTVHSYVKELHRRFDVSSRSELLLKALAR